MKLPKTINKLAIATGFREPPRRRGLGKKNPVRIAQELGALALVPSLQTLTTKIQPNGASVQSVRAYKEVAGVGGINSDWAITALSEDSDVWQNQFILRSRMRDLFRTDSYFAKWIEESWANVFGSEGINCRMRVKETEDRVVYAPDEKAFRTWHERRAERVHGYVNRRYGVNREYRANATIQVGDLDVYANNLIEDAWAEWKRREYCTVSGTLNYNEVCQIRLLSAARDGDYFIRHVRDPKINDFGYSLQLINSEWCDFYLNDTLSNGNEIRMGIERDRWGKRIAYWFVKRQPMDWQFSTPGFGYSGKQVHERVPADDIIHYARYKDGDSTRPAPWGVSNILISRHLGKYQESEVAAARVGANKMGFFTSNLVAEGGMGVGEQPDPTRANTLEAEPGSFQGLPWGIDFKEWNPQHPNQNFAAFRKEMLRAWCAGMPGANYNIIANDLEGVNYSSGRLGMLDERELWKLIQKFDIEVAERPIFENWLYMSLLVGAITLPLAKFDKFNKPVFRGRRWAWVDPLKEVQANALQVANKFISRTRVIEDSDVDADFEEVLFELAEEEMLMEELGIDTMPVIGKPGQPTKPAPDAADTEDPADGTDGSPNEADGTSKALSPEEFERQLALAKAGASVMNITNPPITIAPPPINIIGVKIPEQKAPIVNVAAAKSPEVVVNVAPPAVKVDNIVNVPAPEVNIENNIDVPTTKNMTVKRNAEGKMIGAEFQKE
jgi:lambda family phage portal protein